MSDHLAEIERLKIELERANKTIAHIYELAMTEDGLADFDSDSIRDAWMGYVSREELDEKQNELEQLKSDVKPLVEALSELDREARALLERDDPDIACEDVLYFCRPAIAHAKAKGLL